MIRYIIGVDGGGTGTRARIVSLGGDLLGSGEAGPSGLGQGIEQAWSNVVVAIERAFGAARIASWTPAECALGLGLAGAIVPTQRNEFLARGAAFARLALASDGYTTLLGAHLGAPGAVVAAGTGSIGEAIDHDGRHVVVGGWGYPVDDEGGGAWIGMRAVRQAQRTIDARTPAGGLVRAVQGVVGSDRSAVLNWCKLAGPQGYAALAPLVFDAAADDAFADDLLGEAARALDDIARALDPAGALPLVVAGSIGTRLMPRLAGEVRARTVPPAEDAMAGALRLIRSTLVGGAAA